MVSSFLVFGSCNSRDIFYSKVNENYKQFFKILGDSQRASLISLMQEPLSFNENQIKVFDNGVINDFRTRNVRSDLSKSFLEILKNNPAEYLLIDNHFEIEAGILELDDGNLITHNNDIQNCELYNHLNKKRIITMEKNTSEYLKLYSENCDLFFEYLEKYCPDMRVILNVTRWVSNILNKNNEVEIYEPYIKRAEIHNKYRAILDGYVCKNFDVEILPFDKNTFALMGHWGGDHPSHFDLSYLHDKTQQLKEIIARDKVLNASDEFKMFNKKFRNLRRENFMLSEFNSEQLDNLDVINKANSDTLDSNKLSFFDKCMAKNEEWILLHNILVDISDIGTKIYSNSYQEGFYYINRELNKDFDYVFSFKWVGGNALSPIIQIRQIENMDIVTSFQRQSYNLWQMYTNAKINQRGNLVDFEGHKDFNKAQISPNSQIRLIKNKNNIKVYCDNTLVIDYDVNFQSNFYIGFGGHSLNNRTTIVKDVSLKQCD